MLSSTVYAVIVALAALILACSFAGSCRVEPFEDEQPDVIDGLDNAGQLDAEKLPREDAEAESSESDKPSRGRRGDNRVPADAALPAEEGESASAEAPVAPDEEKQEPAHEEDMPDPSPPPPSQPPSEGFAVEPFVGGMMARF